MTLYEQFDLLIKFGCALIILYVAGILVSVTLQDRASRKAERKKQGK